jgi:hypothetical protein
MLYIFSDVYNIFLGCGNRISYSAASINSPHLFRPLLALRPVSKTVVVVH